MQPRGASRAGVVALVVVGVVLTAVGALLVLPLREAWRPCFETAHYDSRECFLLQTDFSNGAEAPVWFALVAACVVGLVLSAAAPRIRPAVKLLTLLLLVLFSGNPIADYVMVPFFNGGYISHDSPPGAGMWTSASIAGAGLVLIWGAAGRRRRDLTGP